MNPSVKQERRLLYAIGWVKNAYILEMEQPVKKKYINKKLWLAAAVIAAMLILAGCVAAFLRLQDMSVGKKPYTQYFDRQGRYSGPVEKEKDVIVFTGYAGSPEQMAAKEWYEFQESYDPNRALLTNEANLADIPDAEEAVYGCYTQEMVETLHELADKYGLQLLDVYTPIQKYQSGIALKALDVDTLLKPDAPAKMGDVSGLLYSPYNFKLTYDVTIDGLDTYLVGQYYHRNGYFPRSAAGYYDLSEWQQWDYTTPDGVKLLLALSSKGKAEIIADLGHGFMSIGFDTYDGPSLYPQPDEIITKEELEQAAEVFAYDLPFQKIDVSAIQPELDAAEAAHRAEHPPYVPPTYPDYDGYMERVGAWFGLEGYDYCFYDWDGDGAEELWITYNGVVDRCIIIENGETKEMLPTGYLCDGGVRHSVFRQDFTTYENHFYGDDNGEFLVLMRYQGNWYKSKETLDFQTFLQQPMISESEALELMAQYPHLELPWRRVLDYTFADGRTVADLIPEPEPGLRLEGDALRQAYMDYVREHSWYSHCGFYDIDGDGVEECLVGDKPDAFRMVYTYANGKIEDLGIIGSECRLCENGIIQVWNLWGLEWGLEIDAYLYYDVSGSDTQLLDAVFYNKATASWQSDLDGTPLPEGAAIAAKYSSIDIGLQKIS